MHIITHTSTPTSHSTWQVHAHLRQLSKAVSMLQGHCDPMTQADLRLQAAAAIQQLCELYRVPRASMVAAELVEFHQLRAQLDALTAGGAGNNASMHVSST